MKNKITDLNNHLFAQLERLSDESLSQEDLDKEITRTDALVKVSSQILETASVSIRAAQLVADYGGNPEPMLTNMGAGNTIDSRLPPTPAAEAKMITAGKKP